MKNFKKNEKWASTMEFWILRGEVPQEVPSTGVTILEFFLIFCGSFGAIDQVARKPDF